jgi:Ca-activated chloride channel family protein
MSELHFIRPYWILAILPAALLLFLMLKSRLEQGRWSDVCDAELLPYILQEEESSHSRWPLIVGFFAALLAIFALAGPTWERLPTPIFRDESALVIVLDLSRSMDATDIKPSRLIRARYKVTDILKQRKEGLTALVAYAGDAFIVTPLTEDTETIESQLNALKTEIMPVQGSNGLLAIEQAIALLQQSSLPQGDILLITDGVSGDLSEQIGTLIGNYRLSVIGVGTTEGAPIKVAGGGFMKDRQGNIVVPKLNPTQLSALARSGQGIYETLTIDDDDIEALVSFFRRPFTDQKQKQSEGMLDQWDEKGPWLLLLVLPFAALFFRKGLLSIVFVLLLPFPQESQALDWQSLWETQEQQGQKAFNRQQYGEAAEKFQSPEWKAAAQYRAEDYQQAAKSLEGIDSADAHYNRGNALAKSGQLEAAKAAYQQALKMAPDDKDAQYNKQQVEEALKKQQEQQSGDKDKKGESKPEEKEGPQEDQQAPQGDQSSEDGAEKRPDSDEEGKEKEQPQQGQQKESEEAPKDENESEEQAQAANPTEEMSEDQQANEQWLKRIPDDPAGLLKRKFRYQYSRRQRQVEQEQAW